MFDSNTSGIFERLPKYEGLAADEARRMFTRCYMSIVGIRTQTLTDIDHDASDFLRRIANELSVSVVFAKDAPDDDRRTAAFVIAEALALLSEFHLFSGKGDEPGLTHSAPMLSLEAALFYVIADFSANAGSHLRSHAHLKVSGKASGSVYSEQPVAEWCFKAIESLCLLNLNPLPARICPITFPMGEVLGPIPFEQRTVERLHARLGECTVAYLHWLAGGELPLLEQASNGLNEIIEALTPKQGERVYSGGYSRVYHFAQIIRLLIQTTKGYSLLNGLPYPEGILGDKYRKYLVSRAVGTSPYKSGRPLLWPSAYAYVTSCVTGDARHAVVSMPTGSGKSFVAEIALSQNLGLGWCLYLTPTNALAQQIRSDLRSALGSLETTISAFVGSEEYSGTAGEVLAETKSNMVAVMTPERASLALRLNPDAFKTCKLVVFDECHLLADSGSGRGILAELVISQIMTLSESCRFLLMSAMVQNPEDLSDWLQEATGASSKPLSISWRPTRTLRGAIGIDHKSFTENRANADTILSKPGLQKFTANYGFIASLQGAWQSTADGEYLGWKLPVEATFVARLSKNRRRHVEDQSWVNNSVAALAQFIANRGISTLAFLPKNRHYVFTVANKVALDAKALKELPAQPEIVGLCGILAEYELGVNSVPFQLLERGIAVHSAGLIDTEKIASEASFSAGSVLIMLATGTLAQGLNLPATAVIIGGTDIGYNQGEDPSITQQRQISQLLNAAGRAGRAGFANHGFVIAVPSKWSSVGTSFAEILRLRENVGFLKHPDNAVKVRSELEGLIDQIASGQMSANQVTKQQLQLLSLLEYKEESTLEQEKVLRKTLGSWQLQKRGLPDRSELVSASLRSVQKDFVDKSGAPAWLPMAAHKAGLNFFTMLSLLQAWQRIGPDGQDCIPASTAWWLQRFVAIVMHIPPNTLLGLVELEDLQKTSKGFGSAFKEMLGLQFVEGPQWDVPTIWKDAWLGDVMPLLFSWIGGDSYAEMARFIIEDEDKSGVMPNRNSGSAPIPKLISITSEVFSMFSILAGGMLAIAENSLKDLEVMTSDEVPIGLSNLPVYLRYGVDSPDSLAWFRFGVRLRRPAHLLSKVFPLENPVLPDQQLREAVRSLRKPWLKTPADVSAKFPDHKAVLEAIAAFIKADIIEHQA